MSKLNNNKTNIFIVMLFFATVATSKERICLMQVGYGANYITDNCLSDLHFNNISFDSVYNRDARLLSNLVLRVGIRYLNIYRTYLELNLQNILGPGEESGYGIGQTIYLIHTNNKLSVDFNLIYPYITIQYSETPDVPNLVTVNHFFAIKPIIGLNWDLNKFFAINCNFNYMFSHYKVSYSGYPKTYENRTQNNIGMGFKIIWNAI